MLLHLINLILCFSISLEAFVSETSSIDHLYPYVNQDTLVVFDFDNTLVDAEESFGSKRWRDWVRENVAELEGADIIPKVLIAKHLTNLGRLATSMMPMEGQKTLNLIQALEERHIPFLVLTSRPQDFLNCVVMGFAKSTLIQLQSSGLKIPPIKELEKSSIYEGILFTCGKEKGPFLKKLFEENRYFPKRILFLDNSDANISSMQQEMRNLGIDFFGFHYQYTNPRWQDFDPLIANIQLEIFLHEGRVPDEMEAAQIKAALPDQNAHTHFKNLLLNSYPAIIEKSFSAIRSL